MRTYNQETKTQMRFYYSQLNEKDRRHYAAAEALKLGYGGQKYIIEVLGISERALRRGKRELSNPEVLKSLPPGRVRLPGGGRKKKRRLTSK